VPHIICLIGDPCKTIIITAIILHGPMMDVELKISCQCSFSIGFCDIFVKYLLH